jgi:PAS domain S-box-containing protein
MAVAHWEIGQLLVLCSKKPKRSHFLGGLWLSVANFLVIEGMNCPVCNGLQAQFAASTDESQPYTKGKVMLQNMATVRHRFQSISAFLNARLSKRIVFWVFLSIIAIEVVILVPSVLRRERELLNYLRALSTAQATGSLDATTLEGLNRDNLVDSLGGLETNPVVLGGSLYNIDGQLIGSFGESPVLTWQQSQQGRRSDYYNRWQKRYDAPWDMPPIQGQYVLIVRHDAHWVTQEFFRFIARITGLVIIISVFVTGATLYVLRRLLIEPILQLRQDLLAAGVAIQQDADPQGLRFRSLAMARDDELGEVIAAFEQMFGQITGAITTRKQSETRFRTLVEQAADAFFVVNRQGQIIDVNQNACDSLGYGRDKLLTLTVADVQTTYSPAEFQQIWSLLKPHQPQTREGLHQRQDGTTFPVEVRIGLLDTADDQYILALARDITDRKMTEKAMARLAEIGELATMIVHEVRSPLTTVLLGLNALRQQTLSARNQTRLNLALEESERLQRLLNEILQYARHPVLDRQRFDLNHLVDEVAATLAPVQICQHRRLQITTSPADLPINADRDKLKQVLINLVTNACEAVPEGDVVTWRTVQATDGQITMTIHNGGEPIAADILPKLTQPLRDHQGHGQWTGIGHYEAHRRSPRW